MENAGSWSQDCNWISLLFLSKFCKGNSYDCTDLHMHFQSFSSQTVPTNSDISPQVLEKTISPLDFKTYSNLFTSSCSLIKILRTLTLNSYMRSLLAENCDASADIPLSKVVVLFQPKYMEKIRNFKPSQEDLSNAFYQLVKFYFAHCISAGPFSLHLNKSATVARLRQGY